MLSHFSLYSLDFSIVFATLYFLSILLHHRKSREALLLSCSFSSWSCIKEKEILLLSIMGWQLGEFSLLPLIFWFDVSYLLSLVLWAEESLFSSIQQFQ
jgi:hypothetical protein